MPDYSAHPDAGLAFKYIEEANIYLHQLNPTIDEQFTTIVTQAPSFLSFLQRNGRVETMDVFNPYFEWVEHVLTPKVFTMDDLSVAGSTTFVVVDTTGLEVDAMLSFTDPTGASYDVVVRVTAITNATSFEGERILMNGVVDVDIVVGSLINVDSTPRQEKGVETPECMTKPTKKRNTMQIIKCGFNISASALKSDIQGFNTDGTRKAGVASIVDVELDSALVANARELNNSIIRGVRQLRTATVNGRMGGMEYMLREEGAVTVAGGALTNDLLNDALKAIRGAGGNGDLVNVLLMHSTQARKFSAINPSSGGQRIERSETVTGSYSNIFVSDLAGTSGGARMEVIVDDNMKEDQVMLLSLSLIKVKAGRAFFVKDVAPKALDGIQWQALGEYSFEMKNAAQQHRLITGLTL